ncbi:MAG: thioredoxin family protein [Candidatus Saganbacteria bacterium]|nr:thioredoxin family protein [Candidatus Saganbacteria bacterium]
MKNSCLVLKILVILVFFFVVGAIPARECIAFSNSGSVVTKPALTENKPVLVGKKMVKIVATKQKAKSTKDITGLDEALKSGVPVIIKLGSDKCNPCRAMNPIIKELAVEQDGKAVFLALDVYQNREMAGKYGVRVIPTVIYFDKHGEPKGKTEGFMNKEQLLKEVDELSLNK